MLVLSEESVRLMRTDRLTAEQKQQSFIGGWFLDPGRGFGLGMSVVTDRTSRQFLGSGWAGHLRLAGHSNTWSGGRSSQ